MTGKQAQILVFYKNTFLNYHEAWNNRKGREIERYKYQLYALYHILDVLFTDEEEAAFNEELNRIVAG